jgi:hypothetical protein
MLTYTNFYDLLYKLILFFAGFLGAVLGADLIEKLIPEWGGGIAVVIFVGSFIAIPPLLKRTLLPEWLPTFLHIRLTLGTKVSPSEAKMLSFLFNGSLDGKWFEGLYAIRHYIDPEHRREYLFQFAKKVADELGIYFVCP